VRGCERVVCVCEWRERKCVWRWVGSLVAGRTREREQEGGRERGCRREDKREDALVRTRERMHQLHQYQ
jgi:hypothetical protein